LLAVAQRHHLAVIEDAAQSISATWRGHKAGSLGTVGCFSFFPSKNLGAAGDGGMCVTKDAALAAHMTRLRNHGMEPRYYHHEVGANFRLDAVQAAILMVKLPHLDAWSAARRRNAAFYDARFAGSRVQTPVVRPECVSIYNQYVIRVPDREAVMARLKTREIGHEIYYPVALHQQQCFAYLGYTAGAFPEAERAAREVLALPIYPELTEEMLASVAAAVLDA
jgi:dTDP-4-amino-4,6-dideoxygalactose transaminase